MARPIKLIALDLDGTLLHSDKTISTANRDSVRRAIEAGLHVVLASGRMHYSTAKYARQMDFTPESYIISYSGGMVRQVASEKPLVERPLDAEHAQYLVEFCKERGLHLNYYLGDVLYTVKHDHWSDLYASRTGCYAEFVGDLSRFDGQRPTKLVIIDNGANVAALEPQMRERFGNAVQVLVTDDEYLEFMAPDATKANGLIDIARALGVTREECLAMGDGNNDLSMLKWAGRGIAMANGRPRLLECIKEHAPPADEDGVAQVIDSLLASC